MPLGQIDRAQVLAELARYEEARDAYDSPLTKLAALSKDDEARQRSGYKDVIEAKRDALGAAK